MSRARPPTKVGRQAVSYLLAPATIAALRRLSVDLDLPMARVIDRAVASLEERKLAPALARAEEACRAAVAALGAAPEE